MFQFTPLLGAQSTASASQSLLEFDGGIKVLIDVGWDDDFDAEKLKLIEKHIPTLSFILLTHATTAHLGAFVHCCMHFPLFTRIPIYATTPVISLGRTLLQDIYASSPLASSTIPPDTLAESSYALPTWKDGKDPNILMQTPSMEEIAQYFSLINALKYSQSHQPLASPFSPPLSGLTVTAYSAGHTLGGTIWHIQHGLESIVYAVDWNQAREHVLSGAAWLGGPGTGGSEVLEQLRRPTALICSSKNSSMVTGQRSKRDEMLLSNIRETLARGGSVLIPSDTSARVLEIAYLLEEAWHKEEVNSTDASPLKSARLYLASRTAGATMRYARSMLEWMEEGIVKEFEMATGAQEAREQRRGRQHGGSRGDDDKARAPFDFRHVQLLERKSKVARMLVQSHPKVIIASDTSLAWGFSKDAMVSLASDPQNLIIMTERIHELSIQERGLGRCLWDIWASQKGMSDEENTNVVETANAQIQLTSYQLQALEGQELAIYQQYLARRRQLQNTLQGDTGAALESSADIVDDQSSSSSDTSQDSDVEHQGKALNTATTMQHARNKLGLSDAELGINVLIRRKDVYDYEVRGKKGRERMFPFVARRKRADDFGDLIRPEDFVRADEEDHVGGKGLRGDGLKEEHAVGQKRRWDGLAVDAAGGDRRAQSAQSKRRRAETAAGATPELESSESEAENDVDHAVGPSKVVYAAKTLSINCRITFVDFSGLHDRRTIQMLMPLIKPRKLILVAGDEQETKELAEDLQRVLNPDTTATSTAGEVLTPTVGVTIDASVDTNAWSVKLSRDMARKLQWQQVRGLGVAAITGRLAAATLDSISLQEDEGTAKKKAKIAAHASSIASDGQADTTPVLDVVPTNMSTAVRSIAQPFHVGDLRLADLRKILQSSGLTAEFKGEGVLVINGSVAVRKTKEGKIEVDGGAYSFADPANGEAVTFFKVRKKIYEGLAVVAGS